MADPLTGIRVLDFTHALAGPFGTMIMTDLGAEVISVKQVDARDGTLGNGPFVNGRSTYRFSLDRGKKGVQIDLKKPEGLEVALRLADQSDVIAENFSVGAMERLGLGYEVVSKRNPRLIYASCTGFGQTGPYANRGALDIIVQAMSGMMSITGEADGRPMRVGASIGDTLGGTYLALGVLSALYEREQSGLGQRLDVSMMESLMYNMENAIIRHSATGERPTRIGPRHPLITPFQSFETADGSIAIAGVRDWEAFCAVLGIEELTEDPRFTSGPLRTEHHGELEPLLMEAFKKKPTAEWMELLKGISLTGPVNTVEQVMNDPHIKERGALATLPVPGPEERTVTVPILPTRLSRTPPVVDTPAPAVGEHTRAILSSVLDMSVSEMEALEKDEVIRSTSEA
jgi:CoA:oxalate CoA-transferase